MYLSIYMCTLSIYDCLLRCSEEFGSLFGGSDGSLQSRISSQGNSLQDLFVVDIKICII